MSLGKRIRSLLSHEVVMAWSVRILVVLTLFLLAAGIPAKQDRMSRVSLDYTIIFRSPMFTVLMLAMIGAIYLAIIRPWLTTDRRSLVLLGWIASVLVLGVITAVLHGVGKAPDALKMALVVILVAPVFLPTNWRPKSIGFVLAHAGAVVFLFGAAYGMRAEKRFEGPIPIGEDMRVEQIPLMSGGWHKLGFGFILRSFETDYYPVEYGLYEKRKANPKPAPKMPPGHPPLRQREEEDEFTKIAEYSTAEDRWHLPDGKPFSVGKLKQPDGSWAAQHILADGKILHQHSPTPKRFHAKLRIVIDDDNYKDFQVEVNKPAEYKGWRFYLMNPPREGDNRGTILLRYDPGRKYVIGGIWMLILGVAIVCFFRKSGQDVAVASVGGKEGCDVS